eukprot:15113663-Heterocapsa_arctica.AAC.1
MPPGRRSPARRGWPSESPPANGEPREGGCQPKQTEENKKWREQKNRERGRAGWLRPPSPCLSA